jgi:hypothetical protein
MAGIRIDKFDDKYVPVLKRWTERIEDQLRQLKRDGSTRVIVRQVGTGGTTPPAPTTQPWTAAIWFQGNAAGQTVPVYVGSTDYTVTFPAGLTHWKASVGVNPTIQAVYSFRKNGVEFGTLTVAIDGTLTWAAATATTIGNNEVFSIVEPTDATLADVNITAKGTR